MLIRRLLEEGLIASSNELLKGGDDDGSEKQRDLGEWDEGLRVVQTLNEPRTGAVGHLPVLGPGEVFEYMSGADIATESGAMEGCFHMATVDGRTTPGAVVGDDVEAMRWTQDDGRLFEMPVGRFGLVADDDQDDDDDA